MRNQSGSGRFSYVWALLAVIAVAAGRTLYKGQLPDAYNFLLFVPVVGLLSRLFGVGTGLFATLLSAGAVASLHASKWVGSPEDLIGLGLFMIAGSLVVGACRRSDPNASEAQRVLRTEAPALAPAAVSTPATVLDRDMRIKEIFEGTWDVAIVAMDRNRIVREWNAGASQITGYSRGEVIGRSADELFSPGDRESGIPKREQVVAEHTGKSPISYKLRRKDGREFQAEGMMRPSCNQLGELNGFIKVFTDGTQRQKALLELERRGDEHNREIFNVTYSMAHDMRQYVRGVSTNVAAIAVEVEGLDADARFLVERAEWNAKKMGEMVDGLLNYVRLGKSDIVHPKPVNLSSIAREVALERYPNISLACPPDLWVKGDGELIEEMFQCLFDNASKFGLGSVWFGYDNEQRAYFFRNDGQGFKPEESERIFKPFYRLHGQDIEGIGMGLTFAQRIAELHQGRMWASSSGEGKGATIYFTMNEEEASPTAEKSLADLSTEVHKAKTSKASRSAVVTSSSVAASL